jgi:hypothetical protein
VFHSSRSRRRWRGGQGFEDVGLLPLGAAALAGVVCCTREEVEDEDKKEDEEAAKKKMKKAKEEEDKEKAQGEQVLGIICQGRRIG